jgi:hypothetical protein
MPWDRCGVELVSLGSEMNDRIDEGLEEFRILFVPKCTPPPQRKNAVD